MFKTKKITEPLKKRYCQGINCALSRFLTSNGPKDQNSPATKTTNTAELTLSFDITCYRT